MMDSVKAKGSHLLKNGLAIIFATMLTACGGSGSASTATTTPPTTTPTTTTPEPAPSALGGDAASLGIVAVPESASQSFKDNYVKYTSITAPNGKPINFYAQSDISNEQMARARNILAFYLDNLPLSVYGRNKSLIANQMADNEATLIMLNGSDDGEPPTDGQTLYQTENIIPGLEAYMSNEPRDAAFEEILHLVHDTGIGVDGANTQPGVSSLSPFQTALRTAMENAIAPGINGIPSGAAQLGLWANGQEEWLNELAAENSLTQEYLAGIIDVYYGLQGAINGADSERLYQPTTRAEIQTMDPMGWALVGEDSPRQFFPEYLTYTARIDSSYQGTFTMAFDADQRYTYKSQYLLNAQLTGSNDSNLTGNSQDNRLGANAGDNTIDGAGGEDIAVFQGNFADYQINISGTEATVTDSVTGRNGIARLSNIEAMEFADVIAFVEDGSVVTDADPFLGIDELPIAAQEVVNNKAAGGDITLQLNFRGSITLPDGSTSAWSEEEREPYVAGANRWLEVLSRAGNVNDYELEINITAGDLNEGNGVASPVLTDMYVDGANVFPSSGMFSVNNCLYVEVSSTQCPDVLTGEDRIVEFNANIRHEIGHIVGIGSLWNLDATDDSQDFSGADEGQGDFRNWVANSSAHQGLIYRQPKGVTAYNSFTSSGFDFSPVSFGHLYSDSQNTPANTVRSFSGTVLPSLDTELMAHANDFTPVLFGFLEDFGWVLGANPRPNQP